MTGSNLYESLVNAGLIRPVMTDAEVLAAIERMEAQDAAATVAHRYPGDLLSIVHEQPTIHDRFMMAALTGLVSVITGRESKDQIRALPETARFLADGCMEARKK